MGLVARKVNNFIPDFEGLHLPPIVESLCRFDQGMILLAGPTGLGKSTTIASMLNWINRHHRKHILTLEDPIEYLPAPDSHVAARAEREGRQPEEWLYDFFLGNDGSNLVYIPGTSAKEEVITALLGHWVDSGVILGVVIWVVAIPLALVVRIMEAYGTIEGDEITAMDNRMPPP